MDDIINSFDMSLSKLQETVKDREVWHAAIHGAAESDMTERLNNNKESIVSIKMTKDIPEKETIIKKTKLAQG